ncbi:MAG: hypothetical protein ACREJA_02645 [Candidatus Methylomirabilales bacterium]
MRSWGVLFIGVLVAVGTFLGPLAGAHAFTTDEIKAAIQEHIAQKVKEGGGVFKFKDEATGKDLALEFVKIRIVRKIEGHGYFADVDFRVQGEPERFYDIDFWVRPKGEKLTIVDARIHRYPKKEGNEWVQMTVSPLPWWWAVAQEHPGETADAKAWQVKAAIHTHIADKLKEGGGVYRLKDEKTGEELALEFVKIHDPVRRIKGQGYFACTDFRVQGQPERVYDIDLWLNEEKDKLAVTKVRIHKEPVKEGSEWGKKPRYTFEQDNPVEIP